MHRDSPSDNAPSHRKCGDNVLTVNRMNVGSGGKQPVMMDSMWDGEIRTWGTKGIEEGFGREGGRYKWDES